MKKENFKKEEAQLILEFKGKRYYFSINSFILLIILTPLLIFFSISFFEMKFNYWLQEIVGKHSVFLLNLVFDINVELIQTSDTLNPWIFIIPGGKFVYMSVGCTGIYSICIFIVLFICTPHSKDPETNQDIIWRKTKATIVSTLLIYITNILRITILNYLIYLGFSWGIIHNSIIHLSVQVITHIIIFYFCSKWVPEFFISIYYNVYRLFRKIKQIWERK